MLGEHKLGSEDFRTGLLVVTKRLDTGSPWPISNNPKARYFKAGTKSSRLAITFNLCEQYAQIRQVVQT